jgi:anti-sigma-K factor RskA
MNYDNPELRERLAAEYALGTLRGLARRRLERIMARDQALSELVLDWELRLNRLAETAPAIAPPARVWQKISARLGSAPHERRSLFGAIFGGARAHVPDLKEAGLWNFVGFWRPAGLIAAAAAVALAIFVATSMSVPTTTTHLAVLSDQDRKPILVADLQASADRLVVRALLATPVEPGKDYELWLLPPGGGAPQSIGLLRGRETAFDLSRDYTTTLAKGGLAVSLEPAGGSATGAPTGPVLFVGEMQPTDS